MPFSAIDPNADPDPKPIGCRRVLMVTGIFPPLSQVGVLRSLKFSKYLSEFGCDIDVLAYKPRVGLEDIDQTLALEIPSQVRVHRTRWMLPNIARSPSRRSNRPLKATPAAVAGPPTSDSGPKYQDPIRSSGLYNFLRNIPDNTSPWIPLAIAKGWSLARRCDCIYSSAPPFSTHVIGLWLHRLTGKPLIADFRDPWIGNESLNSFSPWHLKMHARWEKSVIRAASFAINVTDPLRDKLVARYPNEPSTKFVTILNGVDHEEIAGMPGPLARTSPSDPLTMSYFGSLYGSRSPKPLFDAIRLLRDAGSIGPDMLRIRIVGYAPPENAVEISRAGLNDLISLEGTMPRARALSEMGQTGVLLQIGAMDMDVHSLSTKIFEYLASRRPILAIVPEGPIASIIRKLDAGWVVSPSRPDEIAKILLELCRRHKSEGLAMNAPIDISRFTRRYQAGQLLHLMNEAVRENTPPEKSRA